MAISIDQSTKKQTEGVWTNFSGSKFKVASSGSTRFQRSLNRQQAPFRRKIEKGTLDPKISKEILCTAMAEALILDWADVVGSSGSVEFNVENATRALMNNDDLREYLMEFSQDLENFRTEELVEGGKG